jgi:hypothetical protein
MNTTDTSPVPVAIPISRIRQTVASRPNIPSVCPSKPNNRPNQPPPPSCPRPINHRRGSTVMNSGRPASAGFAGMYATTDCVNIPNPRNFSPVGMQTLPGMRTLSLEERIVSLTTSGRRVNMSSVLRRPATSHGVQRAPLRQGFNGMYTTTNSTIVSSVVVVGVPITDDDRPPSVHAYTHDTSHTADSPSMPGAETVLIARSTSVGNIVPAPYVLARVLHRLRPGHGDRQHRQRIPPRVAMAAGALVEIPIRPHCGATEARAIEAPSLSMNPVQTARRVASGRPLPPRARLSTATRPQLPPDL